MAVPVTIILHIDHFHGCLYKFKKAVNKALGKLDNTKLLEIYPDTRNLTISTTEHPEVVKHVLKDVFPNNNIIIIPQKINQPSPVLVPRVNDIAKPVVIMSQVEGLESVEYILSNVSTFKINFTNPNNQPTPSWLPPSLYNAPRNHTTSDQIYGSIPKTSDQFYGHVPTASAQVYGHVPRTRDQVYGHVTTTRDQVYEYPPEYYGVQNHPHDLCTIL